MSKATEKIKAQLKKDQRPFTWLAGQLGVSKQVVNHWMNQGVIPPIEYRKKLNKMFGLRDDWV